MKIAVVVPSPVPFTMGGLERFSWNLVDAINRYTPHQSELIKIPLYEHSVSALLTSYFRFRFTKLDHFDLIVSTKYPSWMVAHRYHIVYMVHPLRGLYDSYDGNNRWWSFFLESPLRFPGIWIKTIIHWLDHLALSPQKIKSYFAISRTVANRENYFPQNVDVHVLYPPTTLQKNVGENQEQLTRNGRNWTRFSPFFFTVSRLDGPKRIEMMIEAMKLIKEDCHLVIGGDGPHRSHLESLASDDHRIHFLGAINDDELMSLYEQCLSTLFVPFNEDYGLVTIEAMMYSKPVITCADSGGPTEIVENEVTGYVVPPNPQALADRMRTLLSQHSLAVSLGTQGYEKVKNITWKLLVEDLLREHDYINPDFEKNDLRRKVTVLSTYPIFPPRGGGQERIYNVYRFLSQYYDITILSFCPSDKPFSRNRISEHCLEIVIPQSRAHSEAQWKIQEKVKHTVTDILMPQLAHLTPRYMAILDYYLKKSDIVIASHPFLFPLIKKKRVDQLIIYESHNVEYLLKQTFLPPSKEGDALLKLVKRVERQACTDSDVVFNTSPEEQKKLNELYNLDLSKAFLSANGVDTKALLPVTREQRVEARNILGFPDKPTILFMGSWHPPNLDAFCFILENLAPRMKEVTFLVMGSVREEFYAYYGRKTLPPNVIAVGAVNEKTKLTILHSADVAINPVTHGSGTNLKMLDYMAAGLPVISTAMGARGFRKEEEDSFLLRTPEQFKEALEELLSDRELYSELSRKGREVIVRRFDWRVIINDMYSVIEQYIPHKLSPVIHIESDEQLGNGWYPAENWTIQGFWGQNTKPVRWTMGDAIFHLPNLSSHMMLIIFIEGMPLDLPLEISLLQTKQVIFRGKIPSSGIRLKIPFKPKTWQKELSFLLKTEIWIPANYYQNEDFRQLGISISSIAVEEVKSL